MSGETISNLLEFSDEVLLHILSYLQTNIKDLVHISHSCTKLDSLLQDKTICEKLIFKWSIFIQRLSLVKFLQHSNRAILITQLNMNDLYWVPSSIIRNIVLKTSNLKELYVAGTSLSWVHLLQVLKSNNLIQCLSYSWNRNQCSDSKVVNKTKLGESLLEGHHENTASWKLQIDSIKSKLAQLRFLLIHISEVFNTNSVIFSSFSSLSYFVSCCSSLGQLFIMSWPKTIQELKNTSTLPNNDYSQFNDVSFRCLNTFVFSVMEPQRIYLPNLVNCCMKSISDNRNNNQLRELWLDHPLLERHLRQAVPGKINDPWPIMDFNNVKSLSLPLLEESAQLFPYLNIQNCKRLQITNGAPRILSLNGIIEKSRNLESFCSKSFNYRMDWLKLIARNPNLVEINVCEDSTVPYPEFCVAISSLFCLRKLALPTYCLTEIKDEQLRSQFCETSSKSSWVSDKGHSSTFDGSVVFKKPRIGVSTLSRSKSNPTFSGLDILTKSCSEIEEFELGFTKVESRPGKIVTESLLTISRWNHLTKLTLDRLPITNGAFLIEIAKSCQLEVLRLSNLGSRAKCVYITELCIAIKFCHKLKDFRLEQNYIGNSGGIMKSLESSRSHLQRCLLISDPNDRPLEEEPVMSLMETCERLSVLYITIGSTPKYICNSIRQKVESRYKNSRPPLSIVVRNSCSENDTPHYPSVHYRQLVLLCSNVCRSSDFPVFV